MVKNKIEERLETLIFLSKENLTIEEMAKFFEITVEEMEKITVNLKENRKNSGINIKLENGVIGLVSNPLYGEDVQRFFNPEVKIKKLTRSTMETLAIIAYRGPITKNEIEQIRGVGCEKAIANLLEKNLIFISGKKKSIGTPNLYEVTEDFYSYLNIENVEELPGFEKYSQIELIYKNIENKEELETIEEKIEVKNEIK